MKENLLATEADGCGESDKLLEDSPGPIGGRASSSSLAATGGARKAEAGHDVIMVERRPDFVASPYINEVCARALRYLAAGQAIHLSGPAGTGKTTVAMHIAAQLGQPVVLIHGDAEHATSDLVGSSEGYQRTKVWDNFIHSVVRSEENYRRTWVDDRLTTACKHGYTLIYDEFTRSRPEANNVLLSILGERVLDLPKVSLGGTYLSVHPSFSAIFTSNPEEYAGVHSCQDALLDRMVTLDLTGYDFRTEVEIIMARSGLSEEDAVAVVRLAHRMTETRAVQNRSTLRGSIVVAKILAAVKGRALSSDATFVDTCLDVFGSHSGRKGAAAIDRPGLLAMLHEIESEKAPFAARPAGGRNRAGRGRSRRNRR